ncbi:hypothetical protein O181_109139, partial [Austropuccinia psidii MF-1]|nr:hypothetical protein [Austropuccinia psidii MF-1]
TVIVRLINSNIVNSLIDKPYKHSPPARQTRSQARAQAVLTPTPRVPLYGTPAVSQLWAQLDIGHQFKGAAPYIREGRGPRRCNSFSEVSGSFQGLSRTIFKGPGEDGGEEQENSVEEEESYGTEGVPAPVGASQSTVEPTLAQSNQPVSHQSEPSLLAIMQKMTQIMANLQEASSSEASRPPAFNNSSMKAPEFFDGTQPFKVRSLIQSYQLIFQNDLSILIYSGATNSFIAKNFEWDVLVIDTPKGEDLTLGFVQGLITFNADHKDYYDPSKSFSNDFYSAKSYAALVDDSRTPSLPSSVHIPSLNCHQSLLSSGDEVYKEIQDLGEDNSVYSLPLLWEYGASSFILS